MREELERRAAGGRPIRMGVSGAGWMGSGFVAQVALMRGMEVSLVADTDLEAALEALAAAGTPREAIEVALTPADAEKKIRAGKRVVTRDYGLAAGVASLDIVVDVTPSPAVGALTALTCIEAGKDVVLVNIEADVTVGRILKRKAAERGVLYTVSSGDEPGCLAELWEYVRALGYEPIAIGKGKNNPLDPSANPDTVRASAERDGKDAYQVASYVDGTKTMFEMCCAANATGCVPIRRGMVGPEATRETVGDVFRLQADGGIVPRPGVVDFVQGKDMAGGVFIVARVPDPRIADDLRYLKVAKGGYVTFFRPYHLWFLEAPLSVARAQLRRETTLVPLDRPVADVLTVAKKDLAAGDALDEFGGFCYRGVLERAEIASDLGALPLGLAPDAVLKRPVARGEVVRWADVELDESSPVVRLRREQDAL